MNNDEFRDLLQSRSAPVPVEPVPLDEIERRIRRVSGRRSAVVWGVAAGLVVTSVIALSARGDDAAPVTSGPAQTVFPPDDDSVQKASEQARLGSRYWWNLLPGKTDIAWPEERSARLEISPSQGQRLGLYVACDGFESNVNVTVKVEGGRWSPEMGDKTFGYNCFEGSMVGLTIPASSQKVVVTIVAKEYAAEGHPDWPPTRPRTWEFGFYERAEKVPADVASPEGDRKSAPQRLMTIDGDEHEKLMGDLLNAPN